MEHTTKYHIEDGGGGLLVDGHVWLPTDLANKTPEQLRNEFYKKWEDHSFGGFPVLQEGETQRQVLKKGELYQRPHVEIYSLDVREGTWRERRRTIRSDGTIVHGTVETEDISPYTFIREAKFAGLQIEAVVTQDRSKPWYRRVLRQEPRKTNYLFVLTAPPRSTPPR